MLARAGFICAVALASAASAFAQSTVQVPAGKHEYVTKTEAKDVLTLEVETGETYYVQASISMGVVAGHSNLAPSTKDVFEGMKAKLKDNTGKDLDPPKEEKK